MTLDDLKKLCAEATEGPWSIYQPRKYISIRNHVGLYIMESSPYTGVRERPDAAFIAAARSAMPLLVAVAEASINEIGRPCKESCHHAFCAALRALEGKGE